ncbi:hypothetical protein EDEG_04221 [Edhazardia aedis USNM 41457]|uniref:Uncharacterized protein n=1 Tax=Edhazardia aedis (strain USNM 41457) TaxID=1003232 RepID=J9DAH9_EDHAE|nr:hypothetical protein EDEG_04221 [Edhazardia aedis USNM 41457]|eukprot:EJW04514.1 hypothetical protein EDEG_04221 [Edhazardia aedis USNM 41457]
MSLFNLDISNTFNIYNAFNVFNKSCLNVFLLFHTISLYIDHEKYLYANKIHTIDNNLISLMRQFIQFMKIYHYFFIFYVEYPHFKIYQIITFQFFLLLEFFL